MYSAYNQPAQDYKSVLDILKERGDTNSSQTSSLPLAAFWYPERNEEQKNKLFQGIGIRFDGLNPQKTEYSFEHPTPAYDKEKPGKTIENSQSSMTDLMILLNDIEETRITIEAKYTEYGKNGEGKEYTPFLQKWYDKDDPTKETRTKRMAILKCWTEYIRKSDCGCGCNLILENEIPKDWHEFPYQFLHRMASACFNCKHPILIYQLFYDKDNFKEMKKFEVHLKEWAEMLLPTKDKLPFFIVETEVTKCPPPDIWNKKSKENHSDLLFSKIIDDKNLYTFGDVTVLNGYTLKEVQ